MKLHWYAKILGWLQFGVTAATQILSQPIHGWQGWLTTVASGMAAVAIHASSSTDGTK